MDLVLDIDFVELSHQEMLDGNAATKYALRCMHANHDKDDHASHRFDGFHEHNDLRAYLAASPLLERTMRVRYWRYKAEPRLLFIGREVDIVHALATEPTLRQRIAAYLDASMLPNGIGLVAYFGKYWAYLFAPKQGAGPVPFCLLGTGDTGYHVFFGATLATAFAADQKMLIKEGKTVETRTSPSPVFYTDASLYPDHDDLELGLLKKRVIEMVYFPPKRHRNRSGTAAAAAAPAVGVAAGPQPDAEDAAPARPRRNRSSSARRGGRKRKRSEAAIDLGQGDSDDDEGDDTAPPPLPPRPHVTVTGFPPKPSPPLTLLHTNGGTDTGVTTPMSVSHKTGSTSPPPGKQPRNDPRPVPATVPSPPWPQKNLRRTDRGRDDDSEEEEGEEDDEAQEEDDADASADASSGDDDNEEDEDEDGGAQPLPALTDVETSLMAARGVAVLNMSPSGAPTTPSRTSLTGSMHFRLGDAATRPVELSTLLPAPAGDRLAPLSGEVVRGLVRRSVASLVEAMQTPTHPIWTLPHTTLPGLSRLTRVAHWLARYVASHYKATAHAAAAPAGNDNLYAQIAAEQTQIFCDLARARAKAGLDTCIEHMGTLVVAPHGAADSIYEHLAAVVIGTYGVGPTTRCPLPEYLLLDMDYLPPAADKDTETEAATPDDHAATESLFLSGGVPPHDGEEAGVTEAVHCCCLVCRLTRDRTTCGAPSTALVRRIVEDSVRPWLETRSPPIVPAHPAIQVDV